MKVLIRLGRIITGLVFIFSGFVKGIDPLGTAYKFNDYFVAFNVSFLNDLALPLSILLCTVEFCAGMMLLTGAHNIVASWAAALFMAVFTPLTLVLAIANPVSDCGCFGDAVHLTNWETFFKNIFITLIIVFVFAKRHDDSGTMKTLPGLLAAFSYAIVFLFFIWYNLTFLPVIDFRPYKPGTNLNEAMAIPPDAPADKYDIRFIYEKDGIQKEFSLADYPADDTAWKFVEQKSVLISKGYTPPVHDLYLVTDDGKDMTAEILNEPGFVLLMISQKLEKARGRQLAEGLNSLIALRNMREDLKLFIVTATSPENANNITAGFTTLFADETTIKTMIRSNPGYLLLHNGTVMAMWSPKGLPEISEFAKDLSALAVTYHRQKATLLIVICSMLITLTIFCHTANLRSNR